ncbi:MAG: glycine--tRNA ligase [candidate division SR1 bacterium CG_4_9_14_3_um_filter_40_9]|nr:MAG: glycine--tRNA ligase [candidate division SR1 bacterium CG_4_9_14_3_um_filter_40_9]
MGVSLETIVAWAKRRGFAYPGSDIYGGLANARDLGPYGTELKKNIEDNRRKYFVQEREDIIGIDSQILMNPKVREASGHVGGFSDPLIDCKKCKSRERADKLIEEYLHKNKTKETELPKHRAGEKTPAEDMMDFINAKKIKCPKCGTCDWTDPKKFNLMFKTQQGVIEGEGTDIYLRPETAQGIFVNFKNILDTMRVRIPFGIAQVGKAFRNEITPGNFMFRVREFYQMEIEYFVENDEKVGLKAFKEWMETSKKRWIDEIGIKKDKLKFREHDKEELSFYSKGTFDVEYEFPRGWGELQGIAYRTDYDLKQHIEHSGKDLQYSDPHTGKRYVPHVIEPSWGLTRAILTAMIDAYDEEKYTDGNGAEQTRVVARFHKNIAPVKFAIIPLVKKDEKMVRIAKEIHKRLSKTYMCEFDDSGNIGKSYRRQDEIGTPYCITVDHQSIDPKDGTVTLRMRDDMKQIRIKPEDIKF